MNKNNYILFFTILLMIISSPNVFSETTPSKEKGFNPTPKILHHIQDAYEWHLWGNVAIPLPVILYSEGKFDIFMSSSFHHGKSPVIKDDRKYTIDLHKDFKDQILETNSAVEYLNKTYNLSLSQNISREELNKTMAQYKVFNKTLSDKDKKPEYKKNFISLSITKNVTSMILSVLLLFFLLIKTVTNYKNKKEAPKGVQSFLEPLILFVRDDIIKSNIGPKHEKFTFFLMTVFFFILINNLLGLTPGAANVTGNIAVTCVLSVFTFVIITISGNKGYWKHIIKPPGTPTVLLPIMIPIEIFGVFTKPFALMIRLFANITAGHIIIFSLISLIFVASNNGENVIAGWSVAPISVAFVLFIFLIEILVAFLQAYIFTLLSAVFIGLAVKEDDH